MKRFNFLTVMIALVLMVTAVSCSTMQGTEDEYYGRRVPGSPNRVYVEDPYRGTVVLERDPYSGRYYEVNSYGSAYGYGNGYDTRYRRYNNNVRSYGYGRDNRYRNNNTYQQQYQQQ